MEQQKKLIAAPPIAPPRPVPFIDHRKNKRSSVEFQVYDKREMDNYINWLEKLSGIKRRKENG